MRLGGIALVRQGISNDSNGRFATTFLERDFFTGLWQDKGPFPGCYSDQQSHDTPKQHNGGKDQSHADQSD